MMKFFFFSFLVIITSLIDFSSENEEEVRGIISYISDKTSQIINTATGSVTGVITNQLMNAANLVNDTCESKVGNDGQLHSTKTGESSCKQTCTGLSSKIRNAILYMGDKLPAFLGNGNVFVIVNKNHSEEPEYKCIYNVSKDRLLCDCPKMSHIYVSEELQEKLKLLLNGQVTTKDLVILPSLIILILLIMFCPMWVVILVILSPFLIPILCLGG